MKLPRWLICLLLGSSVLAVPAAACFLWFTWPARTAREFVDLAAEREWSPIEGMFQRAPDRMIVRFWIAEELPSWGHDELEADSRTWRDLCDGRQHFRMIRSRIEFTVERGKLIELVHSVPAKSNSA